MGRGRIKLLVSVGVVAAMAATTAMSGVAGATPGLRSPATPAARAPAPSQAWTAVPVPDPFATSELNGISCSSPTACTAVGGATGRPSSSSSWSSSRDSSSQASTPTRTVSMLPASIERRLARPGNGARRPGVLTVPAGAGRAAPVEFPMAERWNGQRWRLQHVPSLPGRRIVDLIGVSCPAADDCIAVGVALKGNGIATPVAARWDGRRWSLLAVPTTHLSSSVSSFLDAVDCSSVHFCVAVGFGFRGSTARVRPPSEVWNGHRWREVLMQGVQNGSPGLETVSCSSASACTAAGEDSGYSSGDTFSNPALIERWNGNRWRIQASAVEEDQIEGVSCPSRFNCTAVGAVYRGRHDQQSVEVVETWHGSTWRRLAGVSRQHAALYAVSCDSASCVAVGAQDLPVLNHGFNFLGRTLVQVGSAATWAMQPTPSVAHERRAFYAVACTAGQVCIAVGARSDKLLVERN
jgi:hypothetical protein